MYNVFTLDEDSEMRLAFHFDVIDVPASRKDKSGMLYCLIDFELDLSGDGEFTLKHDDVQPRGYVPNSDTVSRTGGRIPRA